MGTVVEQAVNTAVETVLAEMLKVVGVKFEELKTQVMLMKREVVALKREKALKEKENDNIRAKLRYTELKLKYYRQGVEEELQQRASASTLVRIHPPHLTRTQRGGSGMSPTDASASCSAQTRTPEGALTTSSHGKNPRKDALFSLFHGGDCHSFPQNAPLHRARADEPSECSVLQRPGPTPQTCCLPLSWWTHRWRVWTAVQVHTPAH